MKLTDLLKQSGIEMGKVYTDKDRPPFKMNEASSKVKRQIKSIMKYDHIDDLADYIEQFDIDKKQWRLISSYFDDIRDENMGIKPSGSSKHSKKRLEKLLFKVIKEGKITEKKSDKIRVQGLGVYDHKSLSKKVGKMVDDLSKRNRKGNHTGLGKRQLGTLAAMWEALAEYEEKK